MVLTGRQLKEALLVRGFIAFFPLRESFRLENGKELPMENYTDLFNIYQRHVSRLINEASYEVREESLENLKSRLSLIREYFLKSVQEYVQSHSVSKIEKDQINKILWKIDMLIKDNLDQMGISQAELPSQ